ncbi:NAD(P)/FAD-dependent oxidoreductase [Rhodobacter lacus]|uniref:NAD(P)/FAD-dependent oxidoreductase n=1 Tax=Rhodobacter lacus TaxID=1641972 RepID=A0ABW5A8G5_9RHOB
MVPVENSPALPQTVDVAIVGGGIVGAAAAFYLAQSGQSVALLEKGLIGAEQSGRNWGWVRVAGRDLREIPLALRAQEIWPGLAAALGADLGYRRTGIVYVEKTEAARTRHLTWIAQARPLGAAPVHLSPAEVAEMVPGLDWRCHGALYLPEDGRAEPQAAAPAFANAARQLGAFVHQGCAVRALDIEAGRVAGVITEAGRIRARRVIVAAGAWSSHFLARAGVRLPQLKVLSSALRTTAFDAGVEPCMSFSDFALRKRQDGGYSLASSATSVSQISPDSFRFMFDFLPALRLEYRALKLRFGRAFFSELIAHRHRPIEQPSIYEAVRILDPEPDAAALKSVMETIGKAIPAFAGAQVAQSWGGMIDTTPDVIPVISEVAQLPGCLIGTGFSGHGFGVGPAAGELLAQMASGVTPTLDPKAFALARLVGPERRIEIQKWL